MAEGALAKYRRTSPGEDAGPPGDGARFRNSPILEENIDASFGPRALVK